MLKRKTGINEVFGSLYMS